MLMRFDHVASRIVNNPKVPDSKFKRQFSELTVASARQNKSETGNPKLESGFRNVNPLKR